MTTKEHDQEQFAPVASWWGIHNNHPEIDFVDDGFVALGWDLVAEDARGLAQDRDALKAELRRHYPHKNERAIGAWAGIFVRFVIEASEGDVVVHPHKEEKTVNFGRIAGPYEYAAAAATRRHRRRVSWVNTGVPRDAFTQEALWEIGSTLTFFAIRNHVSELEQYA